MQRPVSVTIFGILNFVFAAFGVVGLIASFALCSVPADSVNSVINLMHQGPGYAAWLKICIPLGLLNCAALLASGAGLLTFKPWARYLSMAYAIYAIAFCLTAMTTNLLLMSQPIFVPAPRPQQLQAAAAFGGPLSGTIGSFFWVVYPVLLLVFMLRPKVAAAFRPSLPPEPQT